MSDKTTIPVIQIDTAVPLPKNYDQRVVYPFQQLKVGESFVIDESKRASVATRASKIAKDTGKKFIVRKTKDNEVRIWRTK